MLSGSMVQDRLSDLQIPALPKRRQSAIQPPRLAPVAQLDRALPSEGKGHTFESCRARHFRSPEKKRVSASEASLRDDQNPCLSQLAQGYACGHDPQTRKPSAGAGEARRQPSCLQKLPNEGRSFRKGEST